MAAAALRTDFRHLLCHDNLTAVVTVVSRDPVSPPELSGNTPVLDVIRPVEINLIKSFGNEFCLAVF